MINSASRQSYANSIIAIATSIIVCCKTSGSIFVTKSWICAVSPLTRFISSPDVRFEMRAIDIC